MNNASELQAGERIGGNGQLYWSQARWEAEQIGMVDDLYVSHGDGIFDTLKIAKPPTPVLLHFRDGSAKTKVRVSVDDDGHVTVECHCPRCEAERVLDEAVARRLKAERRDQETSAEATMAKGTLSEACKIGDLIGINANGEAVVMRDKEEPSAKSGYIGPPEILANLRETARRLKMERAEDGGRDSHRT